jgi:hypothetical protein
MMQGQLSWFLWKLLGYHLVHFLTQSGITQLQPASFTIQAYYIKINELRTAPRFHIASSRGHELSNGFSHHRALRQIRRVFGGAEEPRSRLRICGPSVCFTRGRPPRAHSNVPLYFHDSRFERYLYSGDLGGMLVTISSG